MNTSTRRTSVFLAIVSLAASSMVFAQVATPPAAPATPPDAMAPGAPPPPPMPRGPRPMPPRPDAAAADVNVTSSVQRWLMNPNGEVDGLLLEDGTQVGFPPHLSGALTGVVKLRDKVQVTGSGTAGSADSMLRAVSIKNVSTGKSIVDQPPEAGQEPPAPRAPGAMPALTALSASGKVTRLLHGPMGEVNGAIVDGGSIVRFPPRADVTAASALKLGAPLYATGYGTRNAFGTALEATRMGATAEAAQDVFAPPRVARGPGAGPMPPVDAAR